MVRESISVIGEPQDNSCRWEGDAKSQFVF